MSLLIHIQLIRTVYRNSAGERKSATKLLAKTNHITGNPGTILLHTEEKTHISNSQNDLLQPTLQLTTSTKMLLTYNYALRLKNDTNVQVIKQNIKK